MVYNKEQRSGFRWKGGGCGEMAEGHIVLCTQVGRFTQRNRQHCLKGEGGEKNAVRIQCYGTWLMLVFFRLFEIQAFPLKGGQIAPHVNYDGNLRIILKIVLKNACHPS